MKCVFNDRFNQMEIFIKIQLIVFSISFRHKHLRNLTHHYVFARILKNNLRKIVSAKKQKNLALSWKFKQQRTQKHKRNKIGFIY